MHELALGWRSRLRIVGAILLTFANGVVAATAGAGWWLRVPAALVFLVGAALCLDAIVFAASWRFTPSALEVPTLLSRRRAITGRDDLVVELVDGWWSRLALTGPAGTRTERINPLVSARDLRRWWSAAPD